MAIMIFGDICPDNDYRYLFDTKEYGPFDEKIVQDIRNATLVVANLECPATDNMVPSVKTGPNLRAKPQDIELLGKLGFKVLSLANNHILDYGFLSVEETIQRCNEQGIKTVGAASNFKIAREPIIVEADGKKVGIISFAEAEFNLATEHTPGANHFDPYTSFDDVKRLKGSSDYVIVLYHGGIEHYRYPSPLLQKKCRKFAESGADIVLCQHSHCIGTVENYHDCTILYGQGNSVFGYRERSPEWNEGLVVCVDVLTKTIEYKLIRATAKGLDFASTEDCNNRIEQMILESEIIDSEHIMKGEWVKFCLSQESLDMPLLYGWSRLGNKLNRLLHNKLFKLRYSRRKQMVTMNLLRCEAHHEVVKTILEDRVFHLPL